MNQAKTMSVPQAGALYYDLGRNASYQAARRGDIPTIKIGRLLRVPIIAMERRLIEAGEPSDTPVSTAPAHNPSLPFQILNDGAGTSGGAEPSRLSRSRQGRPRGSAPSSTPIRPDAKPTDTSSMEEN
jgi:hypothetical protein